MRIKLLLASFVLLGAGCVQQAPEVPQTPQIPQAPQIISSFEDCVAAGNPVMESFPRQCRSEDGQHFVEEVCRNQCGNGVCEEIVCLAIGCPCAESVESCPQDCSE